jgi:uncharacterized repeat protein (TIGR01451 family)
MTSFLPYFKVIEKLFHCQFSQLISPRSIPRLLWQSSLMLPLLVSAITLSPQPVKAISVPLSGTKTLISGSECGLATYRLGTTAVFSGKALDLLVEVINEDNDRTGTCISINTNVLTVDIRDEDALDDVAFMDLKITVVEQGTTTPIPVDRLTITGFDLDSNGVSSGPLGTGTDDIYLKQPDGVYISSSSLVQYTEGSFFGGEFQAKLQGRSDGNCNDGPGAAVDITCRGAAIYINGAGGTNTVSSVIVRLQNDNAYGDPNSSVNSIRRFQLSFELSEFEELVTNNSDYGDAPNSYGPAGHSVGASIMLGNGLVPDHEVAQQASPNADADDNDGTTSVKYDDEDAVARSGQPLDGQTFQVGSTSNLDITTFGSGYLSGWIDLNRDGDFNDVGEQFISDRLISSTTVTNNSIPITIPANATVGNSYMRFRFTTAAGVNAAGYSTADGEVEDYAVIIGSQPIASSPNLLLVKRITGINDMTVTNAGDDLSLYKDEATNPYDDNTITIANQVAPTDPPKDTDKWPTPANFLLGGTNGGLIKPNDEVEYTIYFLSSGDSETKNVLFCDRVPSNVSFIPTAFNTQPAAIGGIIGSDRGILAQINGVTGAFSNVQDGDAGQYFPPGTNPASVYPNINCGGTNDNGAIVFRLGNLPPATAPGTPTASYGWVRFRGRVK